jgi:hypothetical protein
MRLSSGHANKIQSASVSKDPVEIDLVKRHYIDTNELVIADSRVKGEWVWCGRQ